MAEPADSLAQLVMTQFGLVDLQEQHLEVLSNERTSHSWTLWPEIIYTPISGLMPCPLKAAPAYRGDRKFITDLQRPAMTYADGTFQHAVGQFRNAHRASLFLG